MTFYLLSKHYNEKFQLYYYDESRPDEVPFLTFNEELPSESFKVLHYKNKW